MYFTVLRDFLSFPLPSPSFLLLLPTSVFFLHLSPSLPFSRRELFPQLHGGSLTREDLRSLVRPLTASQCQAPHLWGCRIIDSSVLACHSAPLQSSWRHLCDPCHTTWLIRSAPEPQRRRKQMRGSLRMRFSVPQVGCRPRNSQPGAWLQSCHGIWGLRDLNKDLKSASYLRSRA